MATTNFKGQPVKLIGEFIQVGKVAPDFELVKTDLSSFSLKDLNGKNVILNIFPSLDTSVCATSVRKFNKMAAGLKDTVVLAISKDLPFAHGRFCTTEGIENVKDGVYYSYLFLEKEGEVFKIDSRTSDAIALAMRCGCPVYTTDEIMESEQLHEVGSTAFSVNVNTVDVVMLKEALSKAIEEENYEQASRLRDEIKRREQEEENTIA